MCAVEQTGLLVKVIVISKIATPGIILLFEVELSELSILA
jgi:hypothetical protein